MAPSDASFRTNPRTINVNSQYLAISAGGTKCHEGTWREANTVGRSEVVPSAEPNHAVRCERHTVSAASNPAIARRSAAPTSVFASLAWQVDFQANRWQGATIFSGPCARLSHRA